MEIDVEDLARRLVVGRKRDGRGIYDPGAKRELIELCQRPGISVAKLARDVGVNANLLASWLRRRGVTGVEIVDAAPMIDTPPTAFVALHLESGLSAAPAAPAPASLQARLPNGVVVDLQYDDVQQLGKLIEALGRVRCFASIKT